MPDLSNEISKLAEWHSSLQQFLAWQCAETFGSNTSSLDIVLGRVGGRNRSITSIADMHLTGKTRGQGADQISQNQNINLHQDAVLSL